MPGAWRTTTCMSWPVPPALRAEVDGYVAQADLQLASFEQVKRFDIHAEDFTVENEQLTPTAKIRRHEIVERYRAQFEALYEPIPAAAP